MFISKMGHEHKQSLMNNQDFGFEMTGVKGVIDGCSQGKHSEVGAKLFCHLYQKCLHYENTFDHLLTIFPDFDAIKEHLLFTTLIVKEEEDCFIMHAAGDGFVILQTHDNCFVYEKLEYGSSPPYYAYNFIDPSYLKKYDEGVQQSVFVFEKSQYKNVGVATDGLAYLLSTDFVPEFERYLLEGKEKRIRLLFNRIHNQLHDDITLVF